MPKLRVHNFSISLDGFAAAPNQSREHPFGTAGDVDPERLHKWMFATRYGREMFGESGGSEGLDNDLAMKFRDGLGATIMGRNMFGPIRGEWTDEEWKGWWGDNPPYHNPVFVLTHHARGPIPMEGGTTFNFVNDGIDSALGQAFDAAQGKDVLLAGGAATIRQFLRAGLVDEMHIAFSPILLGAGERLFDDLPGIHQRYECVELVGSELATHARFARR